MYSFCPHCGQDIGQEQAEGQTLICRHCKQTIGVIRSAAKAVVVDQAEDLIRQGIAARCPVCQQAVEVKTRGALRSLVPHAAKGAPRKICPGGGKAIEIASDKLKGVERVRASMTKDVIQVIACAKNADPTIEELTLEYLDKADRVRLQIDALRELLGPNFHMRDYPLDKPHLAVWSNPERLIVAKTHPQGGYQTMSATEIAKVLDDLRQARNAFFDRLGQ